MAASSTTSIGMAPAISRGLERSELAELFKSGIDFFTRERAEALHAEAFAAEASHHGPVNHRAAQHAAADVVAIQAEAVFGQIADESAGETIARASGIENVLQQIPRNDEIRIAAEQHGAVFAALDHQSMRPHIQNFFGSLAQIAFAREQAGFMIVDQKEVPMADGFQQF